MPIHLIIGAGAGLVSAALFASAGASPALAILLFYLAPLPLCLAGLAWGSAAALVAALTGIILVGVSIGPGAALVFAIVYAIPIVVLVRLILLSRPFASPEGAASGVEWYPPGRLVGWAAVIAGLLASAVVMALWLKQGGYDDAVRSMFDQTMLKVLDPDGTALTKETVEQLATLIAKALPAMLAIVWLTVSLFNLWLAGIIVDASGRALRPWPNLHYLEVPNAFVLVFAIALALSFLPGLLGLLATGFAGAMLFAYVLQGLAVIHVYSLGVPFRGLLLALVYLGILFLGWVAILVAIVGLGEPLFGLRAKSAGRGLPSKHDETD